MIFLGSFLIGNKTSQPHHINHTCPARLHDRRVRAFMAHVSRSDLLKINGPASSSKYSILLMHIQEWALLWVFFFFVFYIFWIENITKDVCSQGPPGSGMLRWIGLKTWQSIFHCPEHRQAQSRAYLGT